MFDAFLSPGAAIALAAVLGLLVGSFLNVVILRLPPRLMHAWREQSREFLELPPSQDPAPAPPGLVWEPSHCPQCKHPLGAIENIPLFSWLVLRGRCRHCRTPISFQYPLVELLSGVAAAIVVWKFGVSWQALAGLGLTWTLIAASGIDVRTQLLPDQLTLPLLWAGLLLSHFPLFVDGADSILGAAGGYLSLWLIYWGFKWATGKEGMGYGDFKLLAALGAWLGVGALLPIVLLSSFVGALVGGTALMMRGEHHQTPIPFGPFIAVAGWVWFVGHEQLAAAYDALLGLMT